MRFQGQYEDTETRLFCNRHRYYDPDTARYVTQDPPSSWTGSVYFTPKQATVLKAPMDVPPN
ncbi:hypothetical protein OU994_30695 [Pseudoduganella sp. SL102]|nr:hypothetical protein OU994_30695 [Pseudoduganella sp. SL102]